ncbi:MAG: RES family NAD+ phosphorylase [Nitriliruptorales bacterium]|nr:RES family NAD+ phosphorylase [Nitriliruptorales bacterium]
MIETTLPPGHVWLRLAKPHYDDPFDPTYAAQQGGRWNPPDSWPTLYLNEDVRTAHAQLRHLFLGRGIDPEDLDDDAPVVLAAATLPLRQTVADLRDDDGLEEAGLPTTYPRYRNGQPVRYDRTQPVGQQAHDAGLRGVWCRSAAEGGGNELAWFPASRAAARPVWDEPKPFGAWRHARTFDDIT